MAILNRLEHFGTPSTVLLLSATILLVAYVGIHSYNRRVPTNAPQVARGELPLMGALGFWTKRWDFFRSNRESAASGNFSFHAGPHTVVGLTGEKGRQLFFESRELGFSEGQV